MSANENKEHTIDKDAVKSELINAILRDEIINTMQYGYLEDRKPFMTAEKDKHKIISDITFEEVCRVVFNDPTILKSIEDTSIESLVSELESRYISSLKNVHDSEYHANISTIYAIGCLAAMWAKRMGFYELFDEALEEAKNRQADVEHEADAEIDSEICMEELDD